MHQIREHGGMGTQCTVEPGGATITTTKKAMGPQCTVAPCCCCCWWWWWWWWLRRRRWWSCWRVFVCWCWCCCCWWWCSWCCRCCGGGGGGGGGVLGVVVVVAVAVAVAGAGAGAGAVAVVVVVVVVLLLLWSSSSSSSSSPHGVSGVGILASSHCPSTSSLTRPPSTILAFWAPSQKPSAPEIVSPLGCTVKAPGHIMIFGRDAWIGAVSPKARQASVFQPLSLLSAFRGERGSFMDPSLQARPCNRDHSHFSCSGNNTRNLAPLVLTCNYDRLAAKRSGTPSLP